MNSSVMLRCFSGEELVLRQSDSENGKSRGLANLNSSQRKMLLAAARESLAARFEKRDEVVDPVGAGDPALNVVCGAFVTLNLLVSADGETFHRRLRGCIGNIIGQQPLLEGVRHLARESAFEDPRFPKLSADELEQVDIEISVLTPLKPVSGYDDIRIGVDGILLSRGWNRAVFLPQVAPEQGWDLETTLEHLALKAGLPAEGWQSPDCSFEVFQAQHFCEEEEYGSV